MQADDYGAAIETAQFRFALIARSCRGLFPMGAIRLTSCVSQRTRLLYPTGLKSSRELTLKDRKAFEEDIDIT